MSEDFVEIPEFSEPGLPPPPGDFFVEFWGRVEAEEVAEAAKSITTEPGAVPSHPEQVGDDPTRRLLLQVRAITQAVVMASGGDPGEVDEVANEMVAYVDFNWYSSGLGALAHHPQAWEAHLVREIYRRWLGALSRRRAPWARSVTDALARLLILVDTVDLDHEDRQLFDAIYVHNLSVDETATAFGLERSELTCRLRQAEVAVRRASVVATLDPPALNRSGTASGEADPEVCFVRHFTSKAPVEAAGTTTDQSEAETLGTEVKQETLFELPPDQLADANAIMVTSLVGRGFPIEDAEDAVQNVLEKILRDPSSYIDKLANLDAHKGWFITTALNAYLMLLRGERRRRQREIQHWLSQVEGGGDVGRDVPDATAVLALASGGVLTARQRSCLEAVLIKRMYIDEIAEMYNISPRAVRAILQRAASRLHRNLLRQAK